MRLRVLETVPPALSMQHFKVKVKKSKNERVSTNKILIEMGIESSLCYFLTCW